MAIEITGYIPAQLSNARGETQSGQIGRSEPTAVQQQTGGRQTTDTVTLTDTSAQLSKVATMISSLPVVDIARVDSVRHALSTGQFRFDPARVAEKMMSFEGARGQVDLHPK